MPWHYELIREHMTDIIIKVSESDEGFVFDIYAGEESFRAENPADGGLCTSTAENALDMAVDQAKELLRRGA